jgi:glyoxylase-like metal-dependent hydrolase (beta-lactamase superfamily II)
VSRQQVIVCDHFSHPHIQPVETPGHAAHHVSFIIGDLLFAGEAGGVCLPFPDGSLYLRPATPPRFFLETSLESLDRLIAMGPQRICYGHIGMRDNAVKMLMAHRKQLLHWFEVIRRHYQEAKDNGDAMNVCADHLLANDPLLKGFADLAPDVQLRERNFMANSIKGYWGYLNSMDTTLD